jgi:structure-specific recognition protein 1
LQIPTKKLKKDPNAPKKGLSAFLFFSKSARSRLKEQFPESKPTDISKLLGEEVGSNGHFL